MTGVDPVPRVSDAERLRRWRLVLGGVADEAGEERAGSPDESGGQGAVPRLDARDRRIDAALGALYDRPEPGGRRGSARTGGLGRSRPGIVRWLGEIRRYWAEVYATDPAGSDAAFMERHRIYGRNVAGVADRVVEQLTQLLGAPAYADEDVVVWSRESVQAARPEAEAG